jgi:hypothetical protein
MKNISVPELSRSYDDDNPTSGRAYNVTPWGLGFSDGSISREASTIGTPIVICVGVLLLFCLCFMPMYEICRHGRLPTGQSQEEQPQQQREELCTKEQKEARAKIIEAYVLQKSIVSLDDNIVVLVLLRRLPPSKHAHLTISTLLQRPFVTITLY